MAAFFNTRSDGSVVVARRTATRRWRWTLALVACLLLGGLPRSFAGTLLNFNTNMGTIQVDLFDDLMPGTVANFLSYVNSSAFANTLVHRSTSLADTGLAVIQGGGYTATTGAGGVSLVPIATDDPIALQYSRANSRGTIAMARQAPPDTATSQWFINTTDNSTTLGQSNGGGYAVFGWVVGTGMSIADTINTLPKSTVGGFPSVPLRNFTAGGTPTQQNLVITNSITVAGTHPSFQNPVLAADVVNDGLLRASDAHALINDLLSQGQHSVVGPFAGTNYLDVNGSNTITTVDIQNVINALLSQNSPGSLSLVALPEIVPAARSELMDSSLSARLLVAVPEPTTLSLAAVAAMALAVGAFWRRRAAR